MIELRFYLISVITVLYPVVFLVNISNYVLFQLVLIINVKLALFYLKIYFKLKIVLKIYGFSNFNLEDFSYLFIGYININESFVLFYLYRRKSYFMIENR